MIKKKEQMRHAVIENMRGGEGAIHLEHVLENSETGDRTGLCSVCTVEPGCSIGLHTHDTNAEIYYMLEGQLELNQNGKICTIQAGDVVFTADGESHSVANRGDQAAKLLAVIFPQ
ncbi:MAG: cupin domain-containing protein [Clostridiales bacterium]|nr:cupin domain-containing protein [Clostridiales bacterium]